MKKEEVLEHLRAAKSAHIKWVQKAKLLINGVDIQESSIPVDSTECNFGQWFYGDGQVLNSLSNNPLECMQGIEKLHFELHDQYLKIFNIYFSNEKKTGFFAKLFGFTKKNISDAESQLAETYYKELEEISKKLLDEINRLERRLIAIPSEKIEQLV
ncbi:CZB domain-containing protein [Sulfurimonas microaerophilic]|uniref:CZB domain-containing protein n=1 Tax=Sulfurimonas microaerophilic TaxID=3058392 RepID=UPI002714E48B|nr:CZB domain-containing protein [Sulfurimonas sp. hsl 1-7]